MTDPTNVAEENFQHLIVYRSGIRRDGFLSDYEFSPNNVRFTGTFEEWIKSSSEHSILELRTPGEATFERVVKVLNQFKGTVILARGTSKCEVDEDHVETYYAWDEAYTDILELLNKEEGPKVIIEDDLFVCEETNSEFLNDVASLSDRVLPQDIMTTNSGGTASLIATQRDRAGGGPTRRQADHSARHDPLHHQPPGQDYR